MAEATWPQVIDALASRTTPETRREYAMKTTTNEEIERAIEARSSNKQLRRGVEGMENELRGLVFIKAE